MKREPAKSLDAHISFLKSQVTGIIRLTDMVAGFREKTLKQLEGYDPIKNPTEYSLISLQANIHDSNLSTLGIANVMTHEFIQFWEQHKAVSELLDEVLQDSKGHKKRFSDIYYELDQLRPDRPDESKLIDILN